MKTKKTILPQKSAGVTVEASPFNRLKAYLCTAMLVGIVLVLVIGKLCQSLGQQVCIIAAYAIIFAIIFFVKIYYLKQQVVKSHGKIKE